MVHRVHVAQHVYKFWVRSQVKSYSFSRFSFHISFKKIAQPSSLLLLSPWLISWLLNAPPSFPQLYFHKGRGKITCHAVAGSQRLHSADGLWGQPGQDKEAGQYTGINHVLLSASRTNTSPVIFLINKFLKLFSAPLKIWCLVSCFVHSKYPKPWTDEWQWQMSVTQTQHSRLLSPCSATVFLLPLSWGYVIQKLSQFLNVPCSPTPAGCSMGPFLFACFLLLMWHPSFSRKSPLNPYLGWVALWCVLKTSPFLGTKIILPLSACLSYSFN